MHFYFNGARIIMLSLYKILCIILILCVVGSSIFPLVGSAGFKRFLVIENEKEEYNQLDNNDTTPPITNHSLDPPEPIGQNGYYICDVEITLNATDDLSGVNRIEYRTNSGGWQTILGDNGTFVFGDDGNDVLIEYKAIDNAGNEEETKSFIINVDQSPPMTDFITLKGYPINNIWYVDFICKSVDQTSGMDRVEMYIEDEHYETVEGKGPEFIFTIQWFDEFPITKFYFHYYDKAGNKKIIEFETDNTTPPPNVIFTGLIQNPIITEEHVSFFAILVFARSTYMFIPIPIIFRQITFPHCYEGYIGKHFIRAVYISSPYSW
jgi:hypothetical protein